MNKYLSLFSLLLICLVLAGCGGSGSSLSLPPGENAGTPSEIQLLPAQYIAQTNSSIYLRARVLDGNGHPVANVPVFFTNTAPIGTLSSTTATSDSDGFAVVTLFSSEVGFATVQSEMNVGSNMVRDRKTLYFSPFPIGFPDQNTSNGTPSMKLDVDGNNNGIYNELDDLALLQTANDTQVFLRATVYDAQGNVVPNTSVKFGSDDSSEVSFPGGDTKTTNSSGQASTVLELKPTFLRNSTMILNVTGTAGNGAAAIVSLNVAPVSLQSMTVTANPQVIKSGGTSDITAQVITSAGTPAPDGTTVSFSLSSGTGGKITMFAQTEKGRATATYTAPALTAGAGNYAEQITAKAGALTGSVTVTVYADPAAVIPAAALVIVPGSVTVASTIATTNVPFTISGGVAPYTVTSSDPTVAYNGTLGSGIWNTANPVVTVPLGAAPTKVTINVFDSAGKNTSADLNIIGASASTPLAVTPTSATLTGGNSQTFFITGGLGPYTVTSSDPSVIPSPGALASGVSQFTATATDVVTATTVAIQVRDSAGTTITVQVTVNPRALTISLNPTIVIGKPYQATLPPTCTSSLITATVQAGAGAGPFVVTSDNPALTYPGTWSFAAANPQYQFTFCANTVPATTTVTFTVQDNTGRSAQTTLTIFPELMISVDKQNVVGLPNPDVNSTDNIQFTISGGTGPYIVSAGNAASPACNNAFFLPNGPWYPVSSGLYATPLDPDRPNNSGNSVDCTLTVTDSKGAIATTTFTVSP